LLLQSLDAVRFFLWVRLRQLEQEKDCLWTGLQVLEQVRSWYRQRLEENRQLQGGAGPRSGQLVGTDTQNDPGSVCVCTTHTWCYSLSYDDCMTFVSFPLRVFLGSVV
uniref:Suppressor APC domain-containing protein 1-like n=1 Tax=Scleropages formosus TaxID=113540 RepID=A0A8C9U4G0_SCLFO